MQDSYGELAHAILLWDLRSREGTRAQQIESEHRLHVLARELNAIGYELKGKS